MVVVVVVTVVVVVVDVSVCFDSIGSMGSIRSRLVEVVVRVLSIGSWILFNEFKP